MSGNEPQNQALLTESQRVLDKQVEIVQNQQRQASKILRVLLTVTGLILTSISIVASLVTTDGLDVPGIGNLLSVIGGITLESAVTNIVIIYIISIFVISLGIMAISAFRVLSPEISGAGVSLIESILDVPVLGNFMKYYFKIVPISNSVYSSLIKREKITLRPGLDGEEVGDLIDDESAIAESIKYNSGCMEKNEEIIKQNRDLLSGVYSTAIVFTTGLVLVVMSLLFSLVSVS
jgi:hypothetical protein